MGIACKFQYNVRSLSKKDERLFVAQLKIVVCCTIAIAIAGCIAFEENGLFPGSALSPAKDLVVGKSVAKDVEAQMGQPTERMNLSSGDIVWFYSAGPEKRFTYAVRISPDGIVREVDQRLLEPNVRKVILGTTTTKGVRELLGPPAENSRMENQKREIWVYRLYDEMGVMRVLSVQFSADGVVRAIDMPRDPKEVSGSP